MCMQNALRGEKCTRRFGLKAELMINPGRFNDNLEDNIKHKRYSSLSGSGQEVISRLLYNVNKGVDIYKEL